MLGEAERTDVARGVARNLIWVGVNVRYRICPGSRRQNNHI